MTKKDQLSSEKIPLRNAKESLVRDGGEEDGASAEDAGCGGKEWKCVLSGKRENKIKKRRKNEKKAHKHLSYEGGLCVCGSVCMCAWACVPLYELNGGKQNKSKWDMDGRVRLGVNVCEYACACLNAPVVFIC